jgi:hypothetical protein
MAGSIKLFRTVPTTVNVTEVTSVGSLPTLEASTITTGVIVALGRETGTVTMDKAFIILRCVVNKAARVRLYNTSAHRDSDATRPNTIPPTPGTQHGVICDLYLDGTNEALDWWLSPCAWGANGDATQLTTIYYTISNLDKTNSATITATISYVPLEQ